MAGEKMTNDIIWDCETYPNVFTINAQHAWLPIEWSPAGSGALLFW